MKYAWAVFRNLIVLGIAIVILSKADSDYEKIVFSLLIMIYLSIDSLRLGLGMASSVALFSLGKELLGIRKLLKERGISNTTLNPVFSEEEIAGKKRESEKYQREFVKLFSQLRKKEKEEIRAHHKAGKDKSSFEPSAILLEIIKEWSTWIIRRNQALEDCDKMIKANLAAVNGASIEEVKEGCKLHSFFVGLDEETEGREKHIKVRKEYWESSWDYILEEESDDFETYEEIRDEDEEKMAEAEKGVDKAWVKFYIESGFGTIIFFLALWHLLKGLHMF